MNQKAPQTHHEKVSLQNQTLQREEAKHEGERSGPNLSPCMFIPCI